MKKISKAMLLVFSFALAAFSAPHSAMADRQTTVSGALAIVQGYDSNIDRTDTDTVRILRASFIITAGRTAISTTVCLLLQTAP